MKRNRSTTAAHTQPVAPGEDDIVAHGSVTDEPHVLLLCTHSVLEFKHGEKGSH